MNNLNITQISLSSVKEDTIIPYIKQELNNGIDIKDIFVNLTKHSNDKLKIEKYSSFKDNYISIFLYHMVESNLSIEDFKHILKTSNYEKQIYRFFDSFDFSCSSIYDKMTFTFYNKFDKSVKFNPDKLHYVYEIINNVHNDNKSILDFHSSRIANFLSHVIYSDINQLSPIFNLIENNPNLKKEMTQQFYSLDHSILRNFADSSYEMDMSIIYHNIKENPIFFKNFLNYLFKSEDNKIKSNLSFIQMLFNSEPDFLNIFISQFNKKCNEINSQPFQFIREITFSLEEKFKKTPFELDLNTIDTNKDIFHNIIPLSILCIILQKSNFSCIKNINADNIKYISDIPVQIDSLKNDSRKYDIFSFTNGIDKGILEPFLKFINHSHLLEKINDRLNISSDKHIHKI